MIELELHGISYVHTWKSATLIFLRGKPISLHAVREITNKVRFFAFGMRRSVLYSFCYLFIPPSRVTDLVLHPHEHTTYRTQLNFGKGLCGPSVSTKNSILGCLEYIYSSANLPKVQSSYRLITKIVSMKRSL